MDSQDFPVLGTSLVAQWLRLHASNVGGLGSLLGSWKDTRSHMLQLRPVTGTLKKKNAKKRFSCAILIFFYSVFLKVHAFSDFKITFICMAWMSIR